MSSDSIFYQSTVPRLFSYNLWNLREHFWDVDIICGNEILKGHKRVLAAASKHFQQILKDTDEIDLSDFDVQILNNILEFIYRGNTHLLDENESKFIECAKKLKVEGLQTKTREKYTELRVCPVGGKINERKSTISKKDITDLSPEILCKILTYLPKTDIVHSVGLVSRQMNFLSRDSSIKMRIEINENTKLETAEYIFSLRSLQIEKLSIRQVYNERLKIVEDFICSLTNLKVLDIQNFGKLPTTFLAKIFRSKSLKDLYITCFGDDCPYEESSFNSIGECKQLRSFYLRSALYPISQFELKALANLKLLKSLSLLSCTMDFEPESEFGEFPIKIANSLSHCSFLIDNKDMTFAHFEMLASLFPNVTRLRSVCRGETHLQLDSQEKILALHSLFQRLRYLKLFRIKCFIFDLTFFRNIFHYWNISYTHDTFGDFLSMEKL